MSDIFKNVTAIDLDIAFKNQGRKVKRKTCNSNGTRYTMNRIMYGNTNVDNKGFDHRFKDKKIKIKEYKLYKNGKWSTVKLSKNARKKLELKGEIIKPNKIMKQFLYAHEIKD